MTDDTKTMIDAYMAAGSAGLEGFEPSGAAWAMPSPESFEAAGRIMADADGMLRARRMQNQAVTMSAVAEALEADLAVSPLVIATGPGVGTHTTLRALSAALDLDFRDVRCGQIQPHELIPAKSGGNRHAFGEAIVEDRATLIMLDEAAAFGREVAVAVLHQIAHEATAPVVAALVVRRDQVDEALDAIAEATGIHRALVPVAELMHDPRVAMPTQRVRVVGSVTTNGSRTGERYLEIDSADMPQTTRFTLVAAEGQDDDDLADALDKVLNADQAAVTLRLDDFELRCGTGDIVAL